MHAWFASDSLSLIPGRDSYLRVLDKYTNAGVYLIHNAFSLGECDG